MTITEECFATTDYAIKSLSLTSLEFKLLTKEERNNLKNCLLAINKDPDNYTYISGDIKVHPEVIEATLNLDGYILKYMPKVIRTDPEYCRLALSSNGLALEAVPDHLQTEELAIIAINNHPAAARLLSSQLRKSKALAKKLYKEVDTTNYLLAFPALDHEAVADEIHHFIPQMISSNPKLMSKYGQFLNTQHPIYRSPLAIELYKKLIC